MNYLKFVFEIQFTERECGRTSMFVITSAYSHGHDSYQILICTHLAFVYSLCTR